MTFISFLKLVEIQTKVASIIPFSLGTLYAFYRFDSFKPLNFILMLVSLLCIDMATTAINNYYDYKKAIKTHGFGYETHNAIVKYNLSERSVLFIIFALLITASTLGLMLFINTNIIVLILGALSFGIGVCYSFGPLPISRTPFGELLSGLFMGLIITFISVYIHIFDKQILSLSFSSGILSLNFHLAELLYIFLLSIPAISGISNIMLANNICDIDDDIENKRYTLPIYIGKPQALAVFRFLYYAAYASIILLVILRVETFLSLLMFITLIPVRKNIHRFSQLQTKKDTFVLSVKNFVIINSAHILMLIISIFIKFYFS